MVEHRVEGGGLAASGGAGDEDDAFGTRHHAPQQLLLRGVEADAVERYDALLAIEDAQYDVLAVNGRLRGAAEIDGMSADVHRDTAILRCACFSDVHAAHHLETHRHGGPIGFVQGTDLAQDAVDTVADAQEARLRLEVNVGGVALDRIGQQCVDQAYHRLAVLVGRDREAAEIDFAGLDFVQDAIDRQFVAVMLIDGTGDFRFAGQHGVDQQIGRDQRAQFVLCDDIVGIGDGDRQSPLLGVVVERQQAMPFCGIAWHHAQGNRIDRRTAEVDRFLAERFAQCIAQRCLGNEAQADQQLADRMVRLHLLQ